MPKDSGAVNDMNCDHSLSGKVVNHVGSNVSSTQVIRRILRLGLTSHARRAQSRLTTSVVSGHDAHVADTQF